MELWVRSQDKTALVKAGVIYIYNKKEIVCSSDYSITELGKYKTQKRALEVLDEIQNIIENKFLVKCHSLMRKNDLERAKLQIEELNNIKCIMSEDRFEIEPINKECIIYEMPKE